MRDKILTKSVIQQFCILALLEETRSAIGCHFRVMLVIVLFALPVNQVKLCNSCQIMKFMSLCNLGQIMSFMSKHVIHVTLCQHVKSYHSCQIMLNHVK
jgi:hypothetical protein